MVATAQVFRALGDPIRLEMIERLVEGATLTINGVCNQLGITRQGARKHLQVLVDAELVCLEPLGRDVVVELEPASLEMAQAFIADLEKKWDKRLYALKEFVEQGE